MSRVRLATPTEVAVPALATLQEQRYRLAYAPTAGSPDSGRDQLVLPRRRFSGHDRLDTGSCDEACPRRRHMWTFLRVNGVEPTNNTADQALSPAVIYRKLSFGTQSRYGTPVSGTPAEGLGNLSTAGPKCLREVWRPPWRPSSNGEGAPSLLHATLGSSKPPGIAHRPVNGYRGRNSRFKSTPVANIDP
jgi:hypothetical protein